MTRCSTWAATRPATGRRGTPCSTCFRASIFGSSATGFPLLPVRSTGMIQPLGETVLMSAARRVGCRLGPGACRTRASGSLRGGASGARCRWGRVGGRGGLRPARGQPGRRAGAAGRRGRSRAPRARARGVGGGSVGTREPAPARQDARGITAWFTRRPARGSRWSAGERIRPSGGTGRRLLVRCFQDARVPRSRRAGWPVLARARRRGLDPGRLPLRRPPSGTRNGGASRRC